MRQEDDDEEGGAGGMGTSRYPCMPSLVALQQMKNRLHMAYLGKKLMKWTALATGREIRRVIYEIQIAYDGYDMAVPDCYIALSRCRFYYPNLNKMVITNFPEKARMRVDTTFKSIAGCRFYCYEMIDNKIDPYQHLGLEKGGEAIQDTKEKWILLLKQMVMITNLRTAFTQIDLENKSATKKMNVLGKIVIPKTTASIYYILSELEELEREEFYRLKKVINIKNRLRAQSAKLALELDPNKKKPEPIAVPTKVKKYEPVIVQTMVEESKLVKIVIPITPELSEMSIIPEYVASPYVPLGIIPPPWDGNECTCSYEFFNKVPPLSILPQESHVFECVCPFDYSDMQQAQPLSILPPEPAQHDCVCAHEFPLTRPQPLPFIDPVVDCICIYNNSPLKPQPPLLLPKPLPPECVNPYKYPPIQQAPLSILPPEPSEVQCICTYEYPLTASPSPEQIKCICSHGFPPIKPAEPAHTECKCTKPFIDPVNDCICIYNNSPLKPQPPLLLPEPLPPECVNPYKYPPVQQAPLSILPPEPPVIQCICTYEYPFTAPQPLPFIDPVVDCICTYNNSPLEPQPPLLLPKPLPPECVNPYKYPPVQQAPLSILPPEPPEVQCICTYEYPLTASQSPVQFECVCPHDFPPIKPEPPETECICTRGCTPVKPLSSTGIPSLIIPEPSVGPYPSLVHQNSHGSEHVCIHDHPYKIPSTREVKSKESVRFSKSIDKISMQSTDITDNTESSCSCEDIGSSARSSKMIKTQTLKELKQHLYKIDECTSKMERCDQITLSMEEFRATAEEVRVKLDELIRREEMKRKSTCDECISALSEIYVERDASDDRSIISANMMRETIGIMKTEVKEITRMIRTINPDGTVKEEKTVLKFVKESSTPKSGSSHSSNTYRGS